MFILKKLFEFRDQSVEDEEKPFLDHLEDLRKVITRIVITLLISTVICFTFKDTMMDVIRLPIDRVWETSMAAKLPKSLTIQEWEAAKENSHATLGLSPTQRDAFYKYLDDDSARQNAEILVIYRSLLLIPEKNRAPFLAEAFPGLDQESKDMLTSLQTLNPSAELGAGSNIKLMGAFKPTEAFMLSMKLSFFGGIIISFPLLMYYILSFVLPGLKKEERKALWPALAIGFGLFLLGASFAYFVVLQNVLEFFYNYSSGMSIQNDWRIGYYISFATQFVLIFGLAFELPVVVMTFVKLGLLSYETMRNTRTYAVLAIVVIAAIITPTPDAFTLMLLAIPMYLMYEICIWLSYFSWKKEKAKEDAEEKERMARLLSAPMTVSRDDEDDDQLDDDNNALQEGADESDDGEYDDDVKPE